MLQTPLFFVAHVSSAAEQPSTGGLDVSGRGPGIRTEFVPEGETRTFAEMPEGEKNRLSHRARAWTELAAYLRTLVPGDDQRLRP